MLVTSEKGSFGNRRTGSVTKLQFLNSCKNCWMSSLASSSSKKLPTDREETPNRPHCSAFEMSWILSASILVKLPEKLRSSDQRDGSEPSKPCNKSITVCRA